MLHSLFQVCYSILVLHHFICWLHYEFRRSLLRIEHYNLCSFLSLVPCLLTHLIFISSFHYSILPLIYYAFFPLDLPPFLSQHPSSQPPILLPSPRHSPHQFISDLAISPCFPLYCQFKAFNIAHCLELFIFLLLVILYHMGFIYFGSCKYIVLYS
jgi:hypothetical protein